MCHGFRDSTCAEYVSGCEWGGAAKSRISWSDCTDAQSTARTSGTCKIAACRGFSTASSKPVFRVQLRVTRANKLVFLGGRERELHQKDGSCLAEDLSVAVVHRFVVVPVVKARVGGDVVRRPAGVLFLCGR